MTPTRPQPGHHTALRLRIQLNEVDPVVWRQLLVPGTVRLAKLGQMLVTAMGWNNSHLHAFRVGDTSYGMQDDDDDDFRRRDRRAIRHRPPGPARAPSLQL